MSKKFGLVIFDCDGVLVDSELITNRIFTQMLNELGIAMTIEDMFEQFVGRSMPQCLEVVTGLLGRPVPDGFVQNYEARSAVALKSELKAVQGIEAGLIEAGAHHTFERMSDLPGLISGAD